VVAGDAVTALGGDGHAAKDVAAADDDAHFDPERPRLCNVGGDAVDDRNVDAEMLFAHQRLARRLQNHAPVQGFFRHRFLVGIVFMGAIHEGHRVVTRCPSRKTS
jgi:hypothetical protein